MLESSKIQKCTLISCVVKYVPAAVLYSTILQYFFGNGFISFFFHYIKVQTVPGIMSDWFCGYHTPSFTLPVQSSPHVEVYKILSLSILKLGLLAPIFFDDSDQYLIIILKDIHILPLKSLA